MTRKRMILGVATAVLALATGGAVLAEGRMGHGWGGGAGKDGFGRRLMSQLDLSDGQKQQVDELLAKKKGDLGPRFAALGEARKALRAQIEAGTPDDAGIRAAAAEVGRLEGELAVARAHLRQELRSVLTPEQAEKLDELKSQHKDRMERFRERRHHREDGGRGDSAT